MYSADISGMFFQFVKVRALSWSKKKVLFHNEWAVKRMRGKIKIAVKLMSTRLSVSHDKVNTSKLCKERGTTEDLKS